MRKCECYVIHGKVRFTIGPTEELIVLSAGEFATLPEGDFEFEVLGPNDCTIVKAWPLPFAIQHVDDATERS